MASRPKRARKPVKRDGEELFDLDSDEFVEAVLEGAPAKKRSRNARGAAGGALDAEDSAAAGGDPDGGLEAAAAAAAAEASEGDSEVADDELADAPPDDDGGGGTSGSDSEEDEEDGDAAAAAAAVAAPAPAGGKPKKERKKRPSTRRLCATYAKQQYGLTDTDLARLTDVEFRPNPHYARGYPMRLYLIRELEELSKKKQELKAHAAEHREELAAQRAEAARARKAAAAAAAAEATRRFDALKADHSQHHGSVRLPDTCIASIMTALAATLEPGGLRGPSTVACDLANAALVCWDFYHAARQGFEELGEAATAAGQLAPPAYLRNVRGPTAAAARVLPGLHSLPGPPEQGLSWALWDRALREPTELKLPELKAAARHLGLTMTGTKAELVLRVLGAFGLQAPTAAPAQLLRAVLLERCTLYAAWDGPGAAAGLAQLKTGINALHAVDHPSSAYLRAPTGSAAQLRAALAAADFAGMEELRTAVAAAQATLRKRMEAQEQERRRMEAQEQEQWRLARSRAGPGTGQGGDRACACGNTAAMACALGCCAFCCRMDRDGPPCGRHGCRL